MPKLRKVAIMGFRSVGKSTLTIQFVEGHFVESYDPTIENTFRKVIRYRNQDYTMELVDTAGQDEYSIFPNAYTLDIHGYILVYSVTSEKSFEVVKVIREKLLDKLGTEFAPIVLVGNKTDLHIERTVSFEQGKSLAEKWKAGFLECSAKHNESVGNIFQSVMHEVERHENPEQQSEPCIIL